jgi:hypothetical protein
MDLSQLVPKQRFVCPLPKGGFQTFEVSSRQSSAFPDGIWIFDVEDVNSEWQIPFSLAPFVTVTVVNQ